VIELDVSLDHPILIMRPGLDDTTERGPKIKYLIWVMEEVLYSVDSHQVIRC
jgi:hypothetical protein